MGRVARMIAIEMIKMTAEIGELYIEDLRADLLSIKLPVPASTENLRNYDQIQKMIKRCDELSFKLKSCQIQFEDALKIDGDL